MISPDLAGARVLVTGAAGFVASHLCERLIRSGASVLGVDDLSTGRRENLSALADHPSFAFWHHDITVPRLTPGAIDAVMHLASPAAPRDYLTLPLATLRAGAVGTLTMAELARRKDAALLLASTSEVYGDPMEHPQSESYSGNVDPVGPRSVYDEAKRFAEAVTAQFGRLGVRTSIARIFNTYGPRMSSSDSRVVPTFIRQACTGAPLTVAGDGTQTRSLCCIDEGYIRPLSILLSSLGAVLGNVGLRLLVVHKDLSAAGQRLLKWHGDRLGVGIDLCRVGISPAGPVSGWVSDAVYLRLAIGEVLGHYERVLYLDADILVLDDLRSLLRMSLDGAALGAVRDPQNPVIGAGSALPGWAELGLPRGREYFNSGVMLLDLSECERQGLFKGALVALGVTEQHQGAGPQVQALHIEPIGGKSDQPPVAQFSGGREVLPAQIHHDTFEVISPRLIIPWRRLAEHLGSGGGTGLGEQHMKTHLSGGVRSGQGGVEDRLSVGPGHGRGPVLLPFGDRPYADAEFLGEDPHVHPQGPAQRTGLSAGPLTHGRHRGYASLLPRIEARRPRRCSRSATQGPHRAVSVASRSGDARYHGIRPRARNRRLGPRLAADQSSLKGGDPE